MLGYPLNDRQNIAQSPQPVGIMSFGGINSKRVLGPITRGQSVRPDPSRYFKGSGIGARTWIGAVLE